MHRQAPGRVTAIDSVQHDPARGVPFGIAGVKKLTRVCDGAEESAARAICATAQLDKA